MSAPADDGQQDVEMPDAATPSAAAPIASAAPAAPAKAKLKRKRDQALDFFSSEFDPLKALYTPGVIAPIPSLPLASWEECADLLVGDSIYDDLFGRSEEAPSAQSMNTVAAAAASLQHAAPLAIEEDVPMRPSTASLLAALSHPSSPASRALNAMLQSTTAAAASMPATPASAACHSAAAAAAAAYHAGAPLPAAVSSGSRMTPEQVQANRERAEKKAQENAARKGSDQNTERAESV
jgi:hypothetical protein